MTDDIVDRLRSCEWEGRQVKIIKGGWWDALNGRCDTHCTTFSPKFGAWPREAAVEIERLRRELHEATGQGVTP